MPPEMDESSVCSTSLTKIGGVSIFLVILEVYDMSLWDFFCISVTINVELFFPSFAYWPFMYLYERSLQFFSPFLLGCLSSYWVIRVIFIFWILALYHI